MSLREMRQSFGDCVFDRDRRELRRGDAIVHCGPKLLALLEHLLDAAPRAATKAEIHERIWPGTFVSDATLTSLVAELRSAIGDDARTPRLVRTIHGYGYAFSGEAVPETEPPPKQADPGRSYRVIFADREVALSPGEH